MTSAVVKTWKLLMRPMINKRRGQGTKGAGYADKVLPGVPGAVHFAASWSSSGMFCRPARQMISCVPMPREAHHNRRLEQPGWDPGADDSSAPR
jgi:hypothetical protein